MPKDNAGAGARGLRAEPSAELLELVRRRYGIGATESPTDLGGSANLNLLVSDGSRRYVVRVYRPHVTAARLDAIHTARSALAAAGLPVAHALPALDGRPWAAHGDRIVEVERFVESDSKMDSWERVEAALPLLGRLHSSLREVAVGPEGLKPLFANYIEPRDALRMTLQGVMRIRSWGPSQDESRLADAAEELAHLVLESGSGLRQPLPRQIAHGDFWDNNVLFRDGRVALITDFDFMGERARIDDLALTLYFLLAKSPPGPASDHDLRRLRGLVDAYDSGLRDRMTREERAALPLAIARQPLWSVGVWTALLDDEQAARAHANGMLAQMDRALDIVRDPGRWREAFA